jgi:hypothetical protein
MMSRIVTGHSTTGNTGKSVLDSEVKRSHLGHTVPNILVPKINNVRFNEILSSRIYCLPWDRVGT